MTPQQFFKRDEAAIEYQPLKQADGSILWYWTLIPLPSEESALASGREATRGAAATAARREALKSGRAITKIRIRHGALTSVAGEDN